jgi:hypothetical protein
MSGPPGGGGSERGIDREKLELEREKHAFQRELELEKLRESRRASWRSMIGPVVIGGLISASVAFYGIYTDRQANERERRRIEAADLRAQANRRSETLIQLVNARERAVTDLRAQMFSALLQHYFDRKDTGARITLLKLIGLNFRDAVQIKPLFEQLDAEIVAEGMEGARPEARRLLRKAARNVIRDQIEQIRQARDGAVCDLELAPGDQGDVDCLDGLKVELLAIGPDGVRVRSNTRDHALLDAAEPAAGQAFGVGYFDMPMIDYTSVDAGRGNLWKYAIVLDEITDDRVAHLKVAVLPVDSYSTQHKYKFDEMLADYLEGTIE